MVVRERLLEPVQLAILRQTFHCLDLRPIRLDGELNGLQQAFSDHHALQCGYCTPGMLMSATALLRSNAHPSEEEIRKGLEGNLCRCTGYHNIVKAVQAAAQAGGAGPPARASAEVSA